MRIALLLVVSLLLLPRQVAAGPVVFMEFLNSDLTFGLVNPDQFGYDLSSWSWSDEWEGWPTTYQAFGGTFVQQTLQSDAGGTVTNSEYLYENGTLQIDFHLANSITGENRTGTLLAPILTLQIGVDEDAPIDAAVFAFYTLGPGVFDASIADALGIGRRTVGGFIDSGLLLTDFGNRGCCGGDYTTPDRQAWDGFADFHIEVPEPFTPILTALGLGGWFWRRRVARHAR
jgi:hypothetical protein